MIFEDIVGGSPTMRNVYASVKLAAASDSNVLITGESGTGKELVSRAIHSLGPRRNMPFVTINCGAIPDTLLESELFGFEKGAFTGANYTKKGLMELADGGTVFYDEIGDVSPLFQVKVLRVLQEGEIMRIGGMRPIKINVRIIAATNKKLKIACARGEFREDLFYRLNVINLHLPNLRERMEDLPRLVSHLIEKHSSKRKDLSVRGISPDALDILKRQTFPGNVRELENIIERAISFTSSSMLMPGDLPDYLMEEGRPESASPARLRDAMLAFEREFIIAALHDSGWNISRAAANLGVYRQQLQRKIKSLRIVR